MKREEIKSYKEACKVIGRRPKIYKDEHLFIYEQLTTIIAALNFISNNNSPWTFRTRYCYIHGKKHGKAHISFLLLSGDDLDYSFSFVGDSLKIKEQEDGKYIIENFRELLIKWFFGNINY